MQAQQDDVITPQQGGTLHGLFLERARRSPDKIAYRHFQQNAWRNFTWREMHGEVARWQAALAGLGLQRGDRVAIMLRNCPYWMMFDQAANALAPVRGGVIKAYAVMAKTRWAHLPDVPAIDESGVSGLEEIFLRLTGEGLARELIEVLDA